MPQTKAFLDGFSYDIFISYGRMDDEPLQEGDGWITQLRRLLARELSSELGQSVLVFQDEQASRNGDLDDLIKEALATSAVFLAVVTPRFCASKWCLNELNWFLSSAKPLGLHASTDYGRLFKVVARHVELELQPEPLRNSTGYEFVRKDSDRDLYYNLPLRDLDNPANKATIEFRRLVRDLEKCLQRHKPSQSADVHSRESESVVVSEGTAEVQPSPPADGLSQTAPRPGEQGSAVSEEAHVSHAAGMSDRPNSPAANARAATRGRRWWRNGARPWRSLHRTVQVSIVLLVTLAAILAYGAMPPAQKESLLIATHYWPQPVEDSWEEWFDLTTDNLPESTLWNYERGSWEILNVPLTGPDGEPVVSEGTGSLVTTGPRWGIRKLNQSYLQREAYYDYVAVFQVRFLDNATDVSWLFRVDGERERGYVFSLVKRNNALYLNGYAQVGSTKNCGVQGSSDGCVPLRNNGRLVTNEYIDPTDVFIVKATVKGFDFQHCLEFLYTRPTDPDGALRRLVEEEDCQAVTPMYDPDRRFRYGSIGFAGPSDGARAAIEYLQMTF